MIYVGFDAAKDKPDCCILGGYGHTVWAAFTFRNTHEGFEQLRAAIQTSSEAEGSGQIKAGLESTGHYSGNLEAFLRDSGVELVVFNPLQVNLYRKSQTLRKTKTE
jgi:transposase